MANNARRFSAVLVLMVGLAMVTTPVAAAGHETEENSQVRSTSSAIRHLIALGIEHSPTLRALSEKINASNGIVFVEDGRCSRGVRACVISLTAAGSKRILWIRVDARRSAPEVLESIAHELQHAVEVLSESTAVNRATMYMTFSRIGMRRDNGLFETAEAVRVGMAVRDEVGSLLASGPSSLKH